MNRRDTTVPVSLALALLLAGCAAASPPTGNAPAPATPETSTVAPTSAEAKPVTPSPAAPIPVLRTSERWFVAWHAQDDSTFAEHHRLTAAEGGAFRETVTRAPTFAGLSAATRVPGREFLLRMTERGLEVMPATGPAAASAGGALEVAAPFVPGTSWVVDQQGARIVRVHIEARETVETAGGPVKDALRVTHRAESGEALAMTTWYDAGLRPVRSEIRRSNGTLVEARSMFASTEPDPAACKAAVLWAKKTFGGK
jgi:hypothetical protein